MTYYQHCAWFTKETVSSFQVTFISINEEPTLPKHEAIEEDKNIKSVWHGHCTYRYSKVEFGVLITN